MVCGAWCVRSRARLRRSGRAALLGALDDLATAARRLARRRPRGCGRRATAGRRPPHASGAAAGLAVAPAAPVTYHVVDLGGHLVAGGGAKHLAVGEHPGVVVGLDEPAHQLGGRGRPGLRLQHALLSEGLDSGRRRPTLRLEDAALAEDLDAHRGSRFLFAHGRCRVLAGSFRRRLVLGPLGRLGRASQGERYIRRREHAKDSASVPEARALAGTGESGHGRRRERIQMSSRD